MDHRKIQIVANGLWAAVKARAAATGAIPNVWWDNPNTLDHLQVRAEIGPDLVLYKLQVWPTEGGEPLEVKFTVVQDGDRFIVRHSNIGAEFTFDGAAVLPLSEAAQSALVEATLADLAQEVAQRRSTR